MAITYTYRNGTTRNVQSVVFNGTAIKKLQYDSGNGVKRIVWCQPYILSVYKGVGVSAVTVNRTASQEPSASIGVLTNGATIYYGDTLTISAKAQEGYVLNSYTTTCSVTDNLKIDVTATPTSYKLSIGKGKGVESVTVTRISSPNGKAALGTLSSGAAIYYGDQLSVKATPSSGYQLNTYKTSYTVQGNVSVSVTSEVKKFNLSITQNTGVYSLTVKRTESPLKGAATVELSNGADIYYGDKLIVTAIPSSGYALNSYTNSYTVTSDITVAPTVRTASYTLTISKDSGVSSVTVTRTSSPYQGASTGSLSNGATIYYGDKLTVSATADTDNYTLNSYYPTSYTVSGNVSVNITTTRKPSLATPGISGSVSHDSNSNVMYITLYLSNPNDETVSADIVVQDLLSPVVKRDTISMSPNEKERTYNVGEMRTTKVLATITLRHSSYALTSNSTTLTSSFGSSGGSSSGQS